MPLWVFAVGWAGIAALGAATGTSLPHGMFCRDADHGAYGGQRESTRQGGQHGVGCWNSGFGAPHPRAGQLPEEL